MDDSLRLVFLSKPSSLHGSHIGRAAPVAVTVSEDYGDWELIQGVQLWGEARLLSGAAKAGALALYLQAFPVRARDAGSARGWPRSSAASACIG